MMYHGEYLECCLPFQCPGGTDNLWEMVAVIKGMDDTLLSEKYSKGIMHMKHLTMFKAVSYILLLQPIGGHKVSMLTQIYQHKPSRKIKWLSAMIKQQKKGWLYMTPKCPY